MNEHQSVIDLACRQFSEAIKAKQEEVRETAENLQFNVDHIEGDSRHLISAKANALKLAEMIGEIEAFIQAKNTLINSGKDRYLHIDYGHGHEIYLDPPSGADLCAIENKVEAIFKLTPAGTICCSRLSIEHGTAVLNWIEIPPGHIISVSISVSQQMIVDVQPPTEKDEMMSLVKDESAGLILLCSDGYSPKMYDWDEDAGDWRWKAI